MRNYKALFAAAATTIMVAGGGNNCRKTIFVCGTKYVMCTWNVPAIAEQQEHLANINPSSNKSFLGVERRSSNWAESERRKYTVHIPIRGDGQH